MTNKIYPALYRSTDGCDYLYLDAANYYAFANARWRKADGVDVLDHENDTNITDKYLANTYGEVVSPEHAEFIIELCKVGGIDFVASKKGISKFKYFRINESYLGFYTEPRNAKSQGPKKITIPLPPKQIQTATPDEGFEMKQIMKNAGDNLVLGWEQDFIKTAKEIINEHREEVNCSDELLASCDEWPKIGDEVLVYSSVRRLMEIKGKAVKVIGKCFHSDGDTILTVEHSSLGVFAVAKGSCIKPKTPEEELRDEIKQEVFSSFAIMPELLARRDVVIGISECVANNIVEYITKKP